MPASQIQLLDHARDLADKLASGATPVKAGTLRSILADFMSAPQPDQAKLRRMLRLLKEGSGGQLARSGSFPDQVLAAIGVLDRILEDSDLTPQELKTLFGWTARLLLIRSDRKENGASPGRSGTGPGRPRNSERRQEERMPRPAGEAKLSAVKQSAFDALARMKTELSKRESGEA